jgi:RNA polymerase sigma factor (sigma-70 family)
MASGTTSPVIQLIRRIAGAPDAAHTTDGHLLDRFVTRREGEAFAMLVRRHGAMVLGVCERVLANRHDAEDAFQATFLVLARSAGSVLKRESVGSWLYGVAYRTALRARAAAARRHAAERQGRTTNTQDPLAAVLWSDLRPVLDKELDRLPEKYRAPVVLCYLEGKTNEEAAQQLGWTKGTVSGRLARARALLRDRLTRRGLALSGGLLATLLAQNAAAASVPTELVNSTLNAATFIAAGQAATTLSGSVAALTQGVLKAMWLTKLKIVTLVGLAVALAAGSAGWLTYATLAADTGSRQLVLLATDEPAKSAKDDKPKEDPAVQKIRDAANRRVSQNNLKQIGLAMHNYHDANNRFPPAAILSKDGKPLLSWRVAILPYIEQDNLYKQFKLDEPWDSAHNKELGKIIVKLYAPVGVKTKEPNLTFYQVFAGKGTMFENPMGSRIADITDGLSNTIMAVEAGNPVPWTKPEDLPYDDAKPVPKLGGLFADNFNALFADGSVRVFKKKFNDKIFRLYITCADGQVIDESQLYP